MSIASSVITQALAARFAAKSVSHPTLTRSAGKLNPPIEEAVEGKRVVAKTQLCAGTTEARVVNLREREPAVMRELHHLFVITAHRFPRTRKKLIANQNADGRNLPIPSASIVLATLDVEALRPPGSWRRFVSPVLRGKYCPGRDPALDKFIMENVGRAKVCGRGKSIPRRGSGSDRQICHPEQSGSAAKRS